MRLVPIPLKIKDTIQSILDGYIKAGVIKHFEGESPVISNLICSKKGPASNDFRLYCDWKIQNALDQNKKKGVSSVTEILRCLLVNSKF